MPHARHLALAAALALFACGDDPPKPDRTPPVVTLTTPTDGERVGADGLVVRGTVIDPKVSGQRRSGVAGVEVNGVAATLGTADAAGLASFEATLADLAPGVLVVEAVAADGKGNLGSARVQVVIEDEVIVEPAGLVGLLIEPPTTVLTKVGGTSRIVVHGIAATGTTDVTATTQLVVEDETIASIAADGTVTAKAAGRTRIIARKDMRETSANVGVELDLTPPRAPVITTWRGETSQRTQTWRGQAEPNARLQVSGVAEPIDLLLPPSGRFMVSLALVPGALNAAVVTLTDPSGNAASYDFPIRQNDAYVDPGALAPSSGDRQRGLVDAELPSPIVVRATDARGDPLPGMAIDFAVVRGEGTIDGRRQARVTTDAAGRAAVRWRLGSTPGEAHELHAALDGDSKMPTVFLATALAPSSGPTAIRGRVFDEDRAPVAGLDVTLLDEGSEFSVDATGKTVQTDALGGFEITYGPDLAEPTGTRFSHLRFDGTRRAAGDRHVRIDFVVPVLPGQRNEGGMFFVPRLPEGVALDLDGAGVVQTAVTLERSLRPGAPPTRVRVPAGTKVTWPANVPSEARRLTLLAIPVNRTPMALPDGLFSQHVLALQPGGTRFDPPLPVEQPNLDRLAPGETVTLFTYDHLQTRFVATGSTTVTHDGSYLVTDPGSGIRVGAWHISPPRVPPPNCPAEATTDKGEDPAAPAKEEPERKLCMCRECDRSWPCWVPFEEEDPETGKSKIEIPQSPCTARRGVDEVRREEEVEEDPCKLEVVCEEEGDVVITSPPRLEAKTVKPGDTVSFNAKCRESEDSAAITWRKTGGEFVGSSTGPVVKVKFPVEGKFTVTAKGGTEDTCEGHDDRVVEVKPCIEVGVVLVCGEKIEKVGDNEVVSGKVTLGLVGAEQYVRVGRAVTAVFDPASQELVKVVGDATWTVDTEIAFFSVRDLTIWRGPFEIDNTGKVTFTVLSTSDDPDALPLHLFAVPIKVRTAQLLGDGVSFDTPDFMFFSTSLFTSTRVKRCNKVAQSGGSDLEPIYEPACVDDEDYEEVRLEDPRKTEFELTGLEIRRTNVLPQGKITITREIELGPFTLSTLSLGYANDEFSGELGAKFGRGLAKTGILLSAVYGSTGGGQDWKLKSVGATASFEREVPFGAASIVVPGIPIVPAMPLGPLYLTTVGVTAEDPGAMIGFGGSPKLTGTLTTAFGPAVKVGEESYVLATGKLSASWSPTELSLDGTVSLLGRLYDPFNRQTLAAKQDVVEGNAVAKLGYSLDGLLSMSFTTTLTLREPIFGKKVASGSLSGSLAQLRNPDRVLGVAQGSVEVVFPENRFFGETTLGRISGTLRQNSLPLSSARPTMEFWLEITHACLGAFSGTCTFYVAQDPVNGLRLYFQVLGGITEYIYGAPPSDATTFQAPSIGVSPGVGARVVYDGDPPAFDLVDDADALEIFLDHPDGPALADLELADGTVLSADTALHPGADGNPGASFNPMPDGRVSYWIVRDAVPGTYRLVDVRGPLTTVRARVQPRSPTITLAEPFEVSEDEVTIAWTGTQGDGTASVDLSARPLDGGPDLPIDAATLSAGERVWSTIGVPPGPYMIVARVDDGLSPPRTVTSLRPVVVGGGAVGLPAPRLVRASPDGAGAVVVSWLPSAGAERYVVAGLRDGARLDPTTIEGVATSARLDATDLDGVVVGALRGDEASPEARVAIGRTIVTRPAVEVVAGSTWRYAPERDDGSAATLALVAGPAGVAVTGGVATWATTVDDLGGHTLRLVIDGRERAATVVVVEAPRAAPIIQRAPPATAVVGQPWTWAFAASGVTLVDGPAGAAVESVEGGQVVRWTPTSGEAIAGEGYVAITVRVTDETTGLWTEETATVHVPDRDDDGLDDAWENASGLDVDAPDDVGADPDEDGRTHAQEAADGTLGDVADSDRDGLDDGDELSTSPRAADSDGDGLLDGAEAALGADPTEVDSDGDGVDDAAEVAAGTPPGQASPDGDGDGLSDQREAMLGTDPTLADSDGDGLDDGDELQLGTRPVAHDSDGDGASDGDEVAAGTDPLRHPGDLDHDGLSDDLERALGTHVGRPDTDGDHFPDRIELEAGTDPLDAADKPDDEPREAPRPTLYAGESARPVRQPFAVTHLGDIVLVPDRDRDRAPDDYEGTWEYDARDAADGASDDDGDGIPMWREAQLGTSPRAADSDGDGVDDGQELQDGTDPNDKDSFISGGAVTGLRVTPSPARLFTNTMLGAATLQLTVLGDRPTGFPSDLTAAARGTSYTLEPAGAGSVSADGYFTAAPGFAGTATITAKNAGLEATASVAIEAFTPVKIAELALPGRPGRVRLDGDRLLVVAGRKLCPVDVAIPEAPVLGACVDVAGNVVDLALRGGLGVAVVDAPPRLLTLALGGGGLTGSPTASLTRTASLPAAPRSLALGDDRAFVATGQGLLTIDLADGQVVGTELPGGDFTHVRRDLERVVVLDAAGELRVYRMITSGLVLESTKTLVPAEQDLAYRGNELWLARGGPGVMRARIGEAPGEEDVLTDAQAYAVAPVSDFFIVGARGPRPLVFVSNRSPIDIPTLGTLDYVVFDPTGLAADREHHFLAGFENNKNLLEIGRHAIYQDTLGVAPTLRPVAPVPGATVSEGPGVVLQVDAQDDVGVDVVRLYVDDALVATLTAPPYRATWPSPGVSQDRSLTIRAEAQDYGGNVGELAPYGVTLKPVVDTTAPTIAMLEPVDGEYLGANTNLRVNVNVLDDIGIDKVLVHLDGALVATIEAPPWQADLVLPSGLAGSPVLTATAVDFGENEATASATMQVVGVDLVAAGVTRIAPDDLTYDGEEILVRDGTLVIDGPHAFEAIYVGRNGVVTHSDATGTDEDLGPHMGIHVGLDLVVGFVGVMPSGGIDVSGRGHWGECQESQGCFADFHAPPRLGASHGGIGGGSPYYFDDVPPPISDDPFAPTELGLGGGYGTNLARPGGDGGGRIRLVADEILLHGRIAANGMSGPTNGAGGAGGAIWLEVGHLEGAGEITADGGAARDGTYGSGGGGRIAVHFGESELDPARVRTRPGVGGSTPRAGAGTVVLAPEGGRPTLIVHDGGRGPGRDNPALGDAYGSTPWAEDVDLVIGGQANLTAAVPLHVPTLTLRDRGEVRQWETSDVVGPTRLELEVDTLVVGPLARVEASGRGGDAGASNSRGGSHGGSGGGDRGARQPTRGDPFAPTELGERGGIGYSIYDPGGDGGGAIRITAGATTLDGTIAADGLRATVDADGADDGAGGSGGSVWLTTGTLTGAGGITADGGAAPPLSDRSGAGGGGRVAVYVTQPTTFAVDALRARPGEARPTYVAAPGTVFVRRAGVSDRIVVDDGERSGHALAFGLGWSEAAPAIEGDIDLVVRGRSQLVAVSPWRLTRLFVEGEAIVTHQDATATLETGLDVVADAVTVGPLAAIDLTGRGWSGRCKDSCSAPMTSGSDSGGSHGGLGGGVNVMPTHGDAFAPVTLGGGGGTNGTNVNHGGDGGGRARIVADAVRIDGRVVAHGARGVDTTNDAGGGAGGSIWITADAVTGEGSIAANGADAVPDHVDNSPGGGGRVAIEYQAIEPGLAERVEALPGLGQVGRFAGPGTVWLAGPGADRTFVIDDGGRGAVRSAPIDNTPSDTPLFGGADVIVRGTSLVSIGAPLDVGTLRLEDAAVLTSFDTTRTYESRLTITADAVVVAAGAAIDVSGRGYAGDCTPLKGTCTNAGMTIGNLDNGAGTAMGASHAGAGGGGTAPRAFGDPFAPTTLGGGGGQGSSNSHLGGHGGGRVAIVADRLALDGVVRADGLPATVGNAGGGAGGSIYLLVGELAGDGALSADGGDGGPTGGGSGGGGRVALVYDALDALAPLDLEGASARGGLGLTPDVGGGPGTVWARQAGAPGRLRIDNGGRAHVNEAAPWPELGPVRVASIDLGVATVTGATWLADELAGLRLVRRADRATGTIDGNTATTFETTMALAADDVVVGRRVLDGALVIAGAARVSLLDELVAGALTLEGGAVLTHPVTPGTAVERGLWLEIAGPITIDPSSSIDVTGRGYAGGCSALTGGCGAGLARTLGNTATGSGTNAGGSHGGLGAGASPAAIYGDADDAWTLGSGGGRGSSNSYYGGHGGGRVFLDADALTLLGAIIADGTDSNPSGGGGGGGGGVRVVVDTLAGAGLVRARGGAAVVPGGGGRVRLDGVSDTFSGSIVVDGGGAGAGAGTIVRD